MNPALSLLDGDDGTGSCIHGVALDSASIAEDEDDFIVVLGADDGLHTLHPVSQSLPIKRSESVNLLDYSSEDFT